MNFDIRIFSREERADTGVAGPVEPIVDVDGEAPSMAAALGGVEIAPFVLVFLSEDRDGGGGSGTGCGR